jgi:uncharacterized small protein (DUF1192 family)
MADQLRASIAELEEQILAATGAEKERLQGELETKRSWLGVLD